jgi:DNA polymerase-3 subunit delta'
MSAALILHDTTKEHVAQFVAQPSHAVLLVGSTGIGKTHLAQHLLAQVLELKDSALISHPYYALISSEKDSISIDAIRELQHFMQLKTIGTKPLRRGIIIEHADTLTTEAQNAFLKLLEEPPADTVIVLTASNQLALLPTIRSRIQAIPIHTPAEQTMRAHFEALGKDGQAINQAFFLSGGLPGLMHALLSEDTAHPLFDGVATAKEVLQKPVFERLALVEGLSKQKDQAIYMLEALQHIARTGLNQAADKKDAARIKQWHRILKVTSEALNALAQNASTKLVLSNAMLHL